MEPNLTILIQAFNFFIVYLLFTYLLFKPAVQYLENEEREKKYIENGIYNQQKSLDNKIEKKNKIWKEYQACFRKNSPEIKTDQLFTLEGMKKEPEILEFSKKEIDQFSERMKKTLIERVKHVR